MADRGFRIDRLRAAKRHRPPCAVALLPVERRLPAIGLHARPSIRQPVTGGAIAAVFDESDPFPIGHSPAGDLKRLQILFVARAFTIIVKPVAFMPDLNQTALEAVPVQRLCHAVHEPRL